MASESILDMYKLFKAVVVMLTFAVYTSAGSSNCKCHDQPGDPNKNPTKICCTLDGSGMTNYGCTTLHYSKTDNRCECNNDGLMEHKDDWANCCAANGFGNAPSTDCASDSG